MCPSLARLIYDFFFNIKKAFMSCLFNYILSYSYAIWFVLLNTISIFEINSILV